MKQIIDMVDGIPVYKSDKEYKPQIKELYEKNAKELEKNGINENYITSDNFLNNQNYVFWKNERYLDPTFFQYESPNDDINDSWYSWYVDNILFWDSDTSPKNKIDVRSNFILLDIKNFYKYKKSMAYSKYLWIFFFIFIILGLFYGNYTNDSALVMVLSFSLLIFTVFFIADSIAVASQKWVYYYILRYKPDKLLLLKIKEK